MYLTGFSAGGRATYQYGCALSDKLAAIAVVSSVMRGYPCPLHHPVSELAIVGSTEHAALIRQLERNPQRRRHGRPLARPRRLRRISRAQMIATAWVAGSSTPAVGPVRRRSQVGLFVLTGGYHTWPGTSSAHFPDTGYNASQAIWQFFARLRAASLTTPDASARLRRPRRVAALSVTLQLGRAGHAPAPLLPRPTQPARGGTSAARGRGRGRSRSRGRQGPGPTDARHP